MFALRSLLFGAAAVGDVFAAPTAASAADEVLQDSTPNSEGWHDDFFYSWWSDGASPANYTNLPGGSYSLEWEVGGNLIGGKGWNPGSDTRIINIAGSHESDGTSYLSVYGWTTDPLVEYYIVEDFTIYDPSTGGEKVGQVECDGSTYTLAVTTRIDFITPILLQYWSVRQEKRTGGIVHTGCHFDAWRDANLTLGKHSYQIVATEGYRSSGRAEISVSEVVDEDD